MSTGGIFTLITNDGKQDRMLMATDLLTARLSEINRMKAAKSGLPYAHPENLPSLLDIEKTHVLFTNAHFKPFAAIGLEYNKVTPTSGNPALGQTIQFSIPQFGDFFHDICAHVVLRQPTLTVTGTPGTSNTPLMRWCAFPGERLFKKVTQEVNGNPLDQYESHATNFHREYRVATNKASAWYDCVGQEQPLAGYVEQPTWTRNNTDAATVQHRLGMNVYNGAQTPSGQKTGNLELFIPLLFWYNKDVRLSVPSVAIPYGQRFINIELASLGELVDVVPRGTGTWANPNGSLVETTPTLASIRLYINNLFVNPEVHKIYIERIGFSLIRVHRQQVFSTTQTSAELLLNQLKWPIEYLFVGMKIKDYHASSSAATMRQHLDKWHTFTQVTNTDFASQGQTLNKTSNLLTVTGAGATMGITIAGVVSLTGTATAVDLAVGDNISLNGIRLTVATAVAAGATGAGAITTQNALGAAIVAPTVITTAQLLTLDTVKVNAQVPTPTLDTLSIKAHGVNIYDNFPSKFFNAYTAYHYGGPNINDPMDKGACFIPFCLYPGTYQPSGHINVSRAREFYINYNSSVINSGVEGTLVIVASAINFLLITDGSAVLRYST